MLTQPFAILPHTMVSTVCSSRISTSLPLKRKPTTALAVPGPLRILSASLTCTMPDATMMAVQYAKKYGFATTGGSDCHYPDKVGVCATYFEDPIHTMEELVEAIKNHKCKPVFHQDFSYFIWDIDKLQWTVEDMRV